MFGPVGMLLPKEECITHFEPRQPHLMLVELAKYGELLDYLVNYPTDAQQADVRSCFCTSCSAPDAVPLIAAGLAAGYGHPAHVCNCVYPPAQACAPGQQFPSSARLLL